MYVMYVMYVTYVMYAMYVMYLMYLMYVCMYVCMYVYVIRYLCIYIRIHTDTYITVTLFIELCMYMSECVCVLVFRECFQNSTAWGRETLNTSPALGDLDPTLETEIARFLWQTKPWTLEKPMPPMVWELPFITQCHLKPQLLNQILPHEESLDL